MYLAVAVVAHYVFGLVKGVGVLGVDSAKEGGSSISDVGYRVDFLMRGRNIV